jgi:hypothetical protein
VGLDDPERVAVTDDGGSDTSTASDGVAPPTDAPAIDAASPDVDAGRTCTGTVLKTDTFDDRLDAATDGWIYDPNGAGGTIEAKNGSLHVIVPATAAGVNVRRQLSITKAGAKRLCASFTVIVEKPDDTAGYSGNGDTTFGFIHAAGTDGGSYFHGVMLAVQGVFFYAQRGGANDENRAVLAPLGMKWNVFMDADYVADVLTIAINDNVETLTLVRPSATPTATFYLGIRTFGPAPEAEAFFDDVVVTAE